MMRIKPLLIAAIVVIISESSLLAQSIEDAGTALDASDFPKALEILESLAARDDEPPRVYRRVKLSKDEPDEREEKDPVLQC